MLRTLMGIVAHTAGLFLQVPETHAAQAECDDPIDNVARIGWPSRLPLSITEDEDERECRFSVAGVAAGSPPQEDLSNAARLLFEAQPFGDTLLGLGADRELLASIPMMLAAASPEDQPDPKLQTDDFLAAVEECFELTTSRFLSPFSDSGDFASDDDIFGSVQSFDVRCAVASPAATDQLNEFLGGSERLFDLEVPVFVYRNERAFSLNEFLILPIVRR